MPLLQNHPQKGVDFIVRLMNHASTWYGEQKWPGDRLEPAIQVRMQIPGEGDVTQWAEQSIMVSLSKHVGRSVRASDGSDGA